MTLAEMAGSLRRTGAALAAALADVPPGEAVAAPAPGKWSLAEIAGHLVDEEREDFGRRLRLTIEAPTADWPPNDPEGRVRERRWNERPLAEIVEEFRAAREESLSWLESLDEAALAAVHTHPVFGSMGAGDLLASWCAHDLLHLAQIARTRLAHLRAEVKPYSTDYAG